MESKEGMGSCQSWDPAFDRLYVHSQQMQERPDCKYTSFVKTQCRLEGQRDSDKLAKRCQRIKKCFRDCGSGREEIETSLEDYIDQSYERNSGAQLMSASRNEDMNGANSIPVFPASADFGIALRDFMNYAEELKQRNAQAPLKSRSSGLGASMNGLSDLSSTSLHTPWYTRLFHRQAQCSPERQRPWEKYKDDFKEV